MSDRIVSDNNKLKNSSVTFLILQISNVNNFQMDQKCRCRRFLYTLAKFLLCDWVTRNTARKEMNRRTDWRIERLILFALRWTSISLRADKLGPVYVTVRLTNDAAPQGVQLIKLYTGYALFVWPRSWRRSVEPLITLVMHHAATRRTKTPADDNTRDGMRLSIVTELLTTRVTLLTSICQLTMHYDVRFKIRQLCIQLPEMTR